MQRNVHQLWLAANRADDRGDGARAGKLFRRILDLYPITIEADDAAFYLASGHRRQPETVVER